MNKNDALKQYQSINLETEINQASPHRIVQILFEKLLEKLVLAKMAIEEKKRDVSNQHINAAVKIIGGLQASLDMERGGDISKNLNALYHYLTTSLFDANLYQDANLVDSAHGIVKEIKSGWDAIAEEASQVTQDNVLQQEVTSSV